MVSLFYTYKHIFTHTRDNVCVYMTSLQVARFEPTNSKRTEPRGYEHSIDALDWVTDAGHHGVNLLSQVVLSVQAETLLLLELLQGIGSLAGRQRGSVLKENTSQGK